jgi:hypothetical protein
MFYVLRKARKLSLPIDILLQLFDVMVAPILLYGAEVWGYEKNDIAETLYLEFCKYIMKVKKCTPNYILYGELGRVPMSVHVKISRNKLIIPTIYKTTFVQYIFYTI